MPLVFVNEIRNESISVDGYLEMQCVHKLSATSTFLLTHFLSFLKSKHVSFINRNNSTFYLIIYPHAQAKMELVMAGIPTILSV